MLFNYHLKLIKVHRQMENRSPVRIKSEKRLATILPVAEELLKKHGIHQLMLKDVIDLSGVPRATFYKLIPTKETLIAYMAIKAFNVLFSYSDRGKSYAGPARCKFLGMYIGHMMFIKFHYPLFLCLNEINAPSYRTAIDEELVNIIDEKIHRLVSHIQWVIEQGIFNEEITMPHRLSPFDFAFYLWTGHLGVTTMSFNTEPSVMESVRRYKYYVRQLLDVLPWHPTSTEMDLDAEAIKIADAIFPEEMMRVKEQGLDLMLS